MSAAALLAREMQPDLKLTTSQQFGGARFQANRYNYSRRQVFFRCEILSTEQSTAVL